MSSAGKLGQFRTPRHIINMMVQLVKPTLDDKIADLAMGSRVIIMITADSNDGDWLSSPLLENKNMDWCAF
jgi:type I restriction enzyme M protein